MSKFREAILVAAALLILAVPVRADGDAAAGEKLFARCKACHAVGEGAENKVGPHLNGLFGRAAGGVEGYRYSPAMEKAGAGGLVWNVETLATYLNAPKALVPGTRMAFVGLKKDHEINDMIVYLQGFSQDAAASRANPEEAPAASTPDPKQAHVTGVPAGQPASTGRFGLGRMASADEIAAWDIDVRPDGRGLPKGRGSVAQGEIVFEEQCAACHGDFGEAIGRWPVLAGGQDTLRAERPVKTIGSYWPYLSTVYDYVRRAMPFGNARSLTDDEVYALTAYILYLNDVVTDEAFALSDENFTAVRLPNEGNFIDDDRLSEPHYAAGLEPCVAGCRPGRAQITTHAAVLDVTPEGDDGEEPAGGID